MYLNSSTAHVLLNYFRSIAAAILLLPLAVTAQTNDANNATPVVVNESTITQGLGLRIGYNSDYHKATLVYETPKIWGYEFQNGWGRVDLNVGLGISYWKAIGSHSESMGQLSAIPTLRWWPVENFYVELGSGPTVFSRTDFAGKDLGSAFQFGSHIGTGFLIEKSHRIGIRYSHHSNANIKKPNPGLDLVELGYTYQF